LASERVEIISTDVKKEKSEISASENSENVNPDARRHRKVIRKSLRLYNSTQVLYDRTITSR